MTTKIDPNAVFYGSVFNDVDKARIKKSPMWPLLVAMHYGNNGLVSLSEYKENIRPTGEVSTYRAIFCSFIGYPLAAVTAAANASITRYQIHRIDSKHMGRPIEQNYAGCHTLFTSTNIRYLLTKLRKPDNKVIIAIRSLLRRQDGADGQHQLSNDMSTTLASFVDSIRESAGTRPDLNSDVQKWAALVATNKMELIAIPPSARMVIEQLSAYHDSELEKFNALSKYVGEMFNHEKWFIQYMKDYGYLVGKLDGGPLIQKCLDRSLKGYTGVRHHDLVWSIPPTFFRTLNDIDEPYRTEILAAVTHAKIHRSSMPIFNQTSKDPAGYIPYQSCVQKDAYVHTYSLCDSTSIMLLDA